MGDSLLVLLEALGQELLQNAGLDAAAQTLLHGNKLLHEARDLLEVLTQLRGERLDSRADLLWAEPGAAAQRGELVLEGVPEFALLERESVQELGALGDEVLAPPRALLQGAAGAPEDPQQGQLGLQQRRIVRDVVQHKLAHLVVVARALAEEVLQEQAVVLAHGGLPV